MSFNLYHVDASYNVNIIHQNDVNFVFFIRYGVYFYNIHTFDVYVYFLYEMYFNCQLTRKKQNVQPSK